MAEKNPYIAYLLVLIFAFPIFMQSEHIILHHHEHEEENICYDSIYSKDKKEGACYQTAIEKCLICEYEFTTFSPINFYEYNFSQPLSYRLVNSTIEIHPSIAPLQGISLRAPPLST